MNDTDVLTIIDEDYINDQLLKLDKGWVKIDSIISYTSRARKGNDYTNYLNNKIVQAIYSYNKPQRGA